MSSINSPQSKLSQRRSPDPSQRRSPESRRGVSDLSKYVFVSHMESACRYIFKLTVTSLRHNVSVLGHLPDYGIRLMSLHLPYCIPGKQSLGFLQGMNCLEELDFSGANSALIK